MSVTQPLCVSSLTTKSLGFLVSLESFSIDKGSAALHLAYIWVLHCNGALQQWE